MMTLPWMNMVAFAVAGVEAVGADHNLAGEFRRKSSAWPSHPSFSCTSNGARTFRSGVWWLLACFPRSEICSSVFMANMSLMMLLLFLICWLGLKKLSSLEYLRTELLSIRIMTCQSFWHVKENTFKRRRSQYSRLHMDLSSARKELRLRRSPPTRYTL